MPETVLVELTVGVTVPEGVPVEVTVTVEVGEAVPVLEGVGKLVLLGLSIEGDADALPVIDAVKESDGVFVAVTDVVGVFVAVTEVVGVVVPVDVKDTGVAVGDMVNPRLGVAVAEEDGVGKQDRSVNGRATLRKAELPRALTILFNVW